jgi:hypothetical protein
VPKRADENPRTRALREFQEQLTGLDLPQLQALAQSLLARGRESAESQLAERQLLVARRPERRRPRRDVEVTYRVRADLSDTKPPVWRRLDLSSSLMLDELHAVLQAAFGFTDSHLHQFIAGASPHDRLSTRFLCAWEVEDGDADGVDEREVRVDELLVDPGDRLFYEYDFGDGWEFTLKLEKVLERSDGDPRASCVDGRRAGPPEDCGGTWGFEELVASGEFTAEFDLAETDEDVRNVLERGRGVPPLVAELLQQVRPGDVLDELYVLALRAELTVVPPVDVATAERMVERYRWLVERLGADGVRLTSAGYLPPALVSSMMTELQLDPDWIGKGNREDLTPPAAIFREAAQALGLVRKFKGRLVAPAAVRALAAGDPVRLWQMVALRMPLGREGTAQRHASLLALLWTAAGESVRSERFNEFAARVLAEVGWRSGDQALTPWHARRLADSVIAVLDGMSAFEPRRRGSFEQAVTPGGVLLARSALVMGG